MLAALLAKDLRRARRNPVPYLVQLCVPLVITALLGLVFGGGGSDGGGLGKIKFAVVDEDDSPLTGMLRGGFNQGEAGKYLQPVFLPRDEALRQVTNNLLSAAFIIPTNFTRDYLAGREGLKLTLVKNPAQSYHPAILEELLGAAVTGLNAIGRNFREDLVDWRAVISGDHRPSFREVSDLLGKTGERFERIQHRLDPVPVWYEKETRAASDGGKAGGPAFSVFAYILPGLAAMFLMFLADVAMRDLHREVRLRTFPRFCTLPPGPGVFVLSKVIFTFVIVLLGAAIILGGGALIFRIHWTQPLAVVLLSLAFALFAGGLLAFFAAVMNGEKRADVLNGVIIMGLGLAGGCAFPAQALPTFLRDHITPLLPPNWFVEAMRAAQSGDATGVAWSLVALKLTLLGGVLVVLAGWLFRRKLLRGELR
jgi:ABC-type multidrug transport system permease subunit